MDMVIIGGGPNGLMLACELALAGVRPTVVERLPRRSDQPKANGIVGQVVRLLHQRGLAVGDAPMPGFVFGALPLNLAGLEDNPLYGMGIKQPALEELIERRAVELGVEIRRGHELLGFTQDPHGVSVELRGQGARTSCAPATWSAATARTARSGSSRASASPASPRPTS